jgi:hypothetical protein
MDIKCDCGGKIDHTGGDLNPIDTRYWFKCNKCDNKFYTIWMNSDYEYSITRKEKVKSEPRPR